MIRSESSAADPCYTDVQGRGSVREGLPKPVVWGAAILLVLLLVLLVGTLVYWASQPTEFAPLSDVLPFVRMVAVLLAGISVSSLVLAIHFRLAGAYTKGEESFFFFCFGLSLCLAAITGVSAFGGFFV